MTLEISILRLHPCVIPEGNRDLGLPSANIACQRQQLVTPAIKFHYRGFCVSITETGSPADSKEASVQLGTSIERPSDKNVRQP